MISTIHGLQDETTLTKKEGTNDLPEQTEYWVEYWNDTGELVHRSVHVVRKLGASSSVVVGSLV